MRNVNFKGALVLVLCLLLFSCKGKKSVVTQPAELGAGATAGTLSVSFDLYLDNLPVENKVLGMLVVVNRRTSEAAEKQFGPFTVSSHQAYLYTDSLRTNALPGDTLSLYLLARADVATSYVWTSRLNDRFLSSVKDTFISNPNPIGIFSFSTEKRLDVVVK